MANELRFVPPSDPAQRRVNRELEHRSGQVREITAVHGVGKDETTKIHEYGTLKVLTTLRRAYLEKRAAELRGEKVNEEGFNQLVRRYLREVADVVDSASIQIALVDSGTER